MPALGRQTALGTPALGRSERVSQSWGSAATGDRCSKRANPPLVALVTKLGEVGDQSRFRAVFYINNVLLRILLHQWLEKILFDVSKHWKS